jgi:hypothetical protein
VANDITLSLQSEFKQEDELEIKKRNRVIMQVALQTDQWWKTQ